MTNSDKSSWDADDILWGAEAIRQDLNCENTRQVYYLYEKGTLPIGKCDGKLVARRSKLRSAIDGFIAKSGDEEE